MSRKLPTIKIKLFKRGMKVRHGFDTFTVDYVRIARHGISVFVIERMFPIDSEELVCEDTIIDFEEIRKNR